MKPKLPANKYQILFQLAPEVIYSIDRNSKLTSLSSSFEKITGWKIKDWIGKSFVGLIHPKDLPKALMYYAKGLKKPVGPFELRIMTKTRGYIIGEFTAVPDTVEGKVLGQIGIGRDITQRKVYAKKLVESQNQFEAIIQNVADGVTVLNAQGELIYVNEVAAIASGYKSTKDMLKNPRKWVERFELFDENGVIMPLSDIPTRKALVSGKPHEALINYRSKDGKLNRWSITKARAILDEDKNVQLVITILHDLTERMELEKKKDTFISIASHELKTPLTSLKIYTELLEKQVKISKNTKSLEYIKKTQKQVDRLTKLVFDLLDISRIQSGKLNLSFEKFNVYKLAQGLILDMVTLNPLYEISLSGNQNIFVEADKDRIGQVITNLISNAVKYSPLGSKVKVSINKNTRYAKVTVQDFGIGIAEEHKDKIFGRFFRVSENQQGLGIGLYISNEIIKRHSGSMFVESGVNKGSTFTFTIPLKRT